MMHLGVPYGFDTRGRTAEAVSDAAHVRALVELTLLTSPGERVNRPDFGAGLLNLVFEPGSDALVDAAAFMTRAALQRFLQDIVTIEDLHVTLTDTALAVELTYSIVQTGVRETQTVTRLL